MNKWNTHRAPSRQILAFSVLVGLFIIFSKLTSLGYFQQIDFDMTVRLQDKIPARFDAYWEDIAFLVSPVMSVVWGVVLMILGFWKFKRWKKLLVLLIPLGLVFIVGAELYGKSVVEQTPPPFFMLKNPTAHFPTYHEFAVNSYPSGHAARSVYLSFLAGFMIWQYVRQKRVRAILLGILVCFVAAVSIGKIYLGHHWFSDVMGGYFIGMTVSLIVFVSQEVFDRITQHI